MTRHRLRRAAIDDAEAIAALHVASWHSTYGHLLTAAEQESVTVSGRTAVWAARLTTGGTSPEIVVAESTAAAEPSAAGPLVGFIAFGPTTDADDDATTVGQVYSLHVDPLVRGQGYGRRLLHEAVERLVAGGRRQVTLWVVAENEAARGFYERQGWQSDGARRREKLAVGDEDGPVVDVVRMRAEPTDVRSLPSFEVLTSSGASGEALAPIAEVVAAGAGSGPDDLYSGAVVAVAHRGRLVLQAAVGHAQTHDGDQALDEPRPMRVDSVFDLASISKVTATTAAMMTLVDTGRVRLDDTIGAYVTEFAGTQKAAITLRQVLTHRAGLWEWQPIYLHVDRRTEIPAFLAELDLRYTIGRGRHYSDLGFMLLGVVIERVTGQRLDAYVRAAIHEPLGMVDTFFNPGPTLRTRIVATSVGNPYERRMIATGEPYPVAGTPESFAGWREYTLVGEANDGNAWYGAGGVAGHAGLFGTAGDLVVFGQTLVDVARGRDAGFATPAVARGFLTQPYEGGQALGFWANRLSAVGAHGGYGHGGFTGTQFLFDPDREVVVVLLTNRLHPGEPYRSIDGIWRDVLRRVVRWHGEVST